MSKKKKSLGSTVMGDCVDCGKPCLLSQLFIVRGEIWRQAGMGGWSSGCLHQNCLEARLKRKLTEADLLLWCIGNNKISIHPDYLHSPEFLFHSGEDRIAALDTLVQNVPKGPSLFS